MSRQILTYNNRLEIEKYIWKGFPYRTMETHLGISYSTIQKEVVRNGGKAVYDAFLADMRAFILKQSKGVSRSNKIAENIKLQNRILKCLENGLAPEAMVGRSIRENNPLGVCHPTIYSYIYKHKPEWIKHLPYRKKKKYRPSKLRKDQQNQGKVNISQRCKEANLREELHHYEIDTIHLDKGAILTMVDRKSRILMSALLANRTAEETNRALIKLITQTNGKVKSITSDNGTEFAYFKQITNRFDIPYYHCDPYSSHQRGSNENANRILRRYFKKKNNTFNNISDKHLQHVTMMINSIPRKILNFATAYEVHSSSSVYLLL